MTRASVARSPCSTTRSAGCMRRSPTSRSCVTRSPAAQAETPSNGCDGRRGRSAVGHAGTRVRPGGPVRGAAPLALPKGFARAGGRAFGAQLALEHLVGGGAGQVGGDANVSRPRLGGQVGLRAEERLK